MIALKFLARGAVGPFTGFHWPTPSPSAPGEWIEASPEKLPARGIHACLIEHLSYWLEDELWEIELGQVVRRAPTQLVASRGRLVRQVIGWTISLGQQLGQACATRVRDSAVALLRQAGRGAEADQLISCPNLLELARVAQAISVRSKTDFSDNIAGYVADTASASSARDFPAASYIAAEFARVATGSAEAARSERAWQGRWIAARLDLAPADKR